MKKQVQFRGHTEFGVFCRSLFGSSGAFEKIAGAPPFADWPTGEELRKYISKITKEDRKKYVYVLVNALGAGEYFGCFPAGSIVRSKRGDIPIEHVVVGDEVLTHRNRWRRVIATNRKFHDLGLVHLDVTGVPHLAPAISATPNHEVFVVPRDDLFRARRDILYKRGEMDWKSSYNEFVSSLNPDWMPIEFIRPGDFLFQPFPIETRNSDFAQKWGDHDFAYLMGLFAAEGCLAERYGRDRNKERSELVERIVFVIGDHEDHIVRNVQRIVEKHGRSVTVKRTPETKSIRLELCWKELAQACLEHIGCHSTEKSLSWDILTMPHGWQEAFLAPYVEGDGHFVENSKFERYNGSVVISTASKNLALDLRLLYARLGIVVSVNGRHNTKATWYNGNPIYTIHIGKTWAKDWNGSTRASSYIDKERGFIISPVRSVSHEKWSGEVFDLTVEEDSSYVVNGIVVHNSNINADYFPWNALAHEGDDYGYKTFLNAHAFQHHKNKDPTRAFGVPVLSVLNHPMKRVELIVRLDRAKAKEEQADGIITRIEAGEFPDVSMGCVPKYAKILRKDGRIVHIEEIREGDEVISHRGRAQRVVSTMVRRHKGTIFHIKPYGHRDALILTEEHPLWIVRAEQMECRPSSKSINQGRRQHVCTPDSHLTKKGCSGCLTRPSFKFEWVRADEVSEGDYLAMPIPTFEAERKFTAVEARLLGYYLAEGYVLKNNSGEAIGVEFCTGLNEIETHDELRKLATLSGLADKVVERDIPERNGKYIAIWDRNLADLCSTHCGSGAKTKFLSASLMGADEETLQLFIGAYANGDGGCYEGSIYFSTASEQLADQLRILLARLRCIASVNEIVHKPSKLVNTETVEFQVRVGKDSAWRLTGSRFSPGRSEKICNKRFFYDFEGTTYLMTPIERIDEVEYDDDVYNFGVENDDSYLIDGLAVHNCKVPFDICSICGQKSKTRLDYCFPPGTPILMADGQFKAIEEVRVGDEVITHTGSTKRVVRLLPSTAHDGLIKITAYGFGDILATPNHPFMIGRTKTGVKGGRKAQLDESPPDWVAAEDVQQFDTVFLPIPKIELSKDSKYSNARVGWLLGLYLAEGSPSFSPGVAHPKSVTLSVNVSESFEDRVKEAVTLMGGDAADVSVCVSEERHSKSIRINNREIAEWLLLMGGRGSHTKTLNPAVWHLGEEFARGVLLGWCDGDGSTGDNVTRIATSSESLARQMQLLAASCGILSGLKLYSRDTNFCHQDIWYLTFSGDASAALREQRPQEVFENQSKLFFWKNYLCSTVRRVEEVPYHGDVFNFEVEDDHSYVAGCFAVHNCHHMMPPPELRSVYGPNKILPDGRRIYVINTMPKFFDISFVFIGADKTAKVMAKVASVGNSVCLGEVCAIPRPSAVVHELTSSPPSEDGFRKVASADCSCGCGGPCDPMSKLADAFGATKVGEIIKTVPAGNFAKNILPAIEASEPDLPKSLLNDLASRHTIGEITGRAASLGIVLKPVEFQRIVLVRMGNGELADELDDECNVFRHVQAVDDSVQPDPLLPETGLLHLLRRFISTRSGLGEPLRIRSVKVMLGVKKPLPTRTPIEHPLLDKISAAYNGYRRNLLKKLSQVENVIYNDPSLRKEILGNRLSSLFTKTANSQILSHDSLSYMMGAYFTDRGLLLNTGITDVVSGLMA
jgi:intein/homing endonuclease